ncbi:hypothetical protein EJ02DRAFT_436870 [Clathrospora elynae]|uniref:DUF7492 domain-containing protein n=1 Tax=Clathrospora elynae TaxID=706981 RepID=A0A6A5SDM7_9PLEO|nr:hypothetical protein EJ02DRAFT_436870 [Clathrospora elynae]
MQNMLIAVVAALAVVPLTMGHTWIEQLRNVNDQGKYVGEYGYPRGMVSKTDPGFNGFSMNFEIPGASTPGNVFITESNPLCHESQRKQEQSQDKYPRLQAVPGGFLAMRYMENGHITKPDNQKGKPKKAGTIFVYGTTEPKEDETLLTVLKWTQDGEGGDKRGKLLTMNDFDDGRCYETNETPLSHARAKSDPNFAMGQAVEGKPGNYPLFCETNVQLPETAELGKPYTLYWVWQWNTAPGSGDASYPKGKDEYYTTCIDVDVASKDVAMAAAAEQEFALGPQQDAMTVAVKDFASRTAIMTNPVQGEVGPIFSGNSTGSPSGAPPTATPSATDAAPPAASPSATLGAPSIGSIVPSFSSSTLFSNSTAPAPTQIPNLTKRPGAAPTSQASDGNVVIVTDTIIVTVTASAAIVTETAATQSPSSTLAQRAAHIIRHKNGAKFRGMFTE